MCGQEMRQVQYMDTQAHDGMRGFVQHDAAWRRLGGRGVSYWQRRRRRRSSCRSVYLMHSKMAAVVQSSSEIEWVEPLMSEHHLTTHTL